MKDFAWKNRKFSKFGCGQVGEKIQAKTV
jgi:hypothetical protein